MDNELRRQFDQINKKLDQISEGNFPRKKQKVSTWKRISIAIPIIVAIIGVIGTAYELGLQFLENQSNRRTIEFYTSLAKSLVENGEYANADSFLKRAEEIDPNNADVVVTKAFIDMMNLIRQSLSDNRDTFSEGTYYLSQLNLEPTEIFYHMGVVAAKVGAFDIAEKYLQNIPPQPNRFSLLARSKLIGNVYLRSLNIGDKELGRSIDETLNNAKSTLIGFANDVQEFEDDPELARNFTDQMYAFGFALMFRLPNENLTSLNELFSGIEPPNEEFLATLQHQLEITNEGEESALANEEKVLQSLYAAKEKSGKYSLVTEPINDAITQISAQIQLEESQAATEISSLESLRKKGVRMRSSREYEKADNMFQSIIKEYDTNNLKADKTLYKTYFNLALLYEYNLHRIDEAIEYYNKAEELAVELQINDASIYSTFGFLYYKLARDATYPEEKTEYLKLAEEKLKAALAIDPKYAKSINTLDGIQMEFRKLEQEQVMQQQVPRMATRRN